MHGFCVTLEKPCFSMCDKVHYQTRKNTEISVMFALSAAGREWFEVYAEENSRSGSSPVPGRTQSQPTLQEQVCLWITPPCIV